MGYFYVALEGAPKTFFEEHSELHNNLKKKMHFDIVIDVLFDSTTKGAREGAPKTALNDLHKDAQEAT